MPEGVLVRKDDIRRLRKMLDAFEHGQLGPPSTPETRRISSAIPTFVAKTTGTISAVSGDTPGSGTVDLHKLDNDDDLIDLNESVTAFNLSDTSIGTDTFIGLLREHVSGKLVISAIAGGGDTSFWAKITGCVFTSGSCSWTEQDPSGLGWEDTPSGQSGSGALASSGFKYVPTDVVVRMYDDNRFEYPYTAIEGELTSPLLAYASATMNVWNDDDTTSGAIITVVDLAGHNVGTGKWVSAIFVSGLWRVIEADC